MSTFNRGKLRKLVEAGKVTMVGSYHFDDMHCEDRSHDEMPVAIKPEDWHDRKQGVCYLSDWDFRSVSGAARINPNGTISLRVHSNCNYTLRINTGAT